MTSVQNKKEATNESSPHTDPQKAENHRTAQKPKVDVKPTNQKDSLKEVQSPTNRSLISPSLRNNQKNLFTSAGRKSRENADLGSIMSQYQGGQQKTAQISIQNQQLQHQSPAAQNRQTNPSPIRHAPPPNRKASNEQQKQQNPFENDTNTNKIQQSSPRGNVNKNGGSISSSNMYEKNQQNLAKPSSQQQQLVQQLRSKQLTSSANHRNNKNVSNNKRNVRFDTQTIAAVVSSNNEPLTSILPTIAHLDNSIKLKNKLSSMNFNSRRLSRVRRLSTDDLSNGVNGNGPIVGGEATGNQQQFQSNVQGFDSRNHKTPQKKPNSQNNQFVSQNKSNGPEYKTSQNRGEVIGSLTEQRKQNLDKLMEKHTSTPLNQPAFTNEKSESQKVSYSAADEKKLKRKKMKELSNPNSKLRQFERKIEQNRPGNIQINSQDRMPDQIHNKDDLTNQNEQISTGTGLIDESFVGKTKQSQSPAKLEKTRIGGIDIIKNRSASVKPSENRLEYLVNNQHSDPLTFLKMTKQMQAKREENFYNLARAAAVQRNIEREKNEKRKRQEAQQKAEHHARLLQQARESEQSIESNEEKRGHDPNHKYEQNSMLQNQRPTQHDYQTLNEHQKQFLVGEQQFERYTLDGTSNNLNNGGNNVNHFNQQIKLRRNTLNSDQDGHNLCNVSSANQDYLHHNPDNSNPNSQSNVNYLRKNPQSELETGISFREELIKQLGPASHNSHDSNQNHLSPYKPKQSGVSGNLGAKHAALRLQLLNSSAANQEQNNYSPDTSSLPTNKSNSPLMARLSPQRIKPQQAKNQKIRGIGASKAQQPMMSSAVQDHLPAEVHLTGSDDVVDNQERLLEGVQVDQEDSHHEHDDSQTFKLVPQIIIEAESRQQSRRGSRVNKNDANSGGSGQGLLAYPTRNQSQNEDLNQNKLQLPAKPSKLNLKGLLGDEIQSCSCDNTRSACLCQDNTRNISHSPSSSSRAPDSTNLSAQNANNQLLKPAYTNKRGAVVGGVGISTSKDRKDSLQQQFLLQPPSQKGTLYTQGTPRSSAVGTAVTAAAGRKISGVRGEISPKQMIVIQNNQESELRAAEGMYQQDGLVTGGGPQQLKDKFKKSPILHLEIFKRKQSEQNNVLTSGVNQASPAAGGQAGQISQLLGGDSSKIPLNSKRNGQILLPITDMNPQNAKKVLNLPVGQIHKLQNHRKKIVIKPEKINFQEVRVQKGSSTIGQEMIVGIKDPNANPKDIEKKAYLVEKFDPDKKQEIHLLRNKAKQNQKVKQKNQAGGGVVIGQAGSGAQGGSSAVNYQSRSPNLDGNSMLQISKAMKVPRESRNKDLNDFMMDDDASDFDRDGRDQRNSRGGPSSQNLSENDQNLLEDELRESSRNSFNSSEFDRNQQIDVNQPLNFEIQNLAPRRSNSNSSQMYVQIGRTSQNGSNMLSKYGGAEENHREGEEQRNYFAIAQAVPLHNVNAFGGDPIEQVKNEANQRRIQSQMRLMQRGDNQQGPSMGGGGGTTAQGQGLIKKTANDRVIVKDRFVFGAAAEREQFAPWAEGQFEEMNANADDDHFNQAADQIIKELSDNSYQGRSDSAGRLSANSHRLDRGEKHQIVIEEMVPKSAGKKKRQTSAQKQRGTKHNNNIVVNNKDADSVSDTRSRNSKQSKNSQRNNNKKGNRVLKAKVSSQQLEKQQTHLQI